MEGFADIDAVIARAMSAWRPPPRLSLSAWADRFYVLSPETAAEPGRWKCLPYQVEILDAITDPKVSMIAVMKSARIGYTLCLSAAIAYFIAQNPSSMLIVQPTVDDAKGFSKETIAPMLRDVPVLSQIAFRDIEDKSRASKGSATLTHKAFPGGVLSLVGANSGSGLRRISRRVVMFDEVDAYPHSAGNEGDPVRLGMKRSEAFHDRLTIAGSTPLIAGASRIEELFLAGDQRRYYVPCPHCGHMDFLVFERKSERGHVMRWENNDPETAYFECRGPNKCRIEHKDKRWMVERGEWVPENPAGAYRSYHLWSALSYSPGATWANIVSDFLAAKDDPEKLKTFVNTTLGETWQERGEAPEWQRLYQRREPYKIRTVPDGVRILTAGVDVQQDRFVYEVVGWAPNKESWSIDAGSIWGDTSNEATWLQLDELLARVYSSDGGALYTIGALAIDSGYNTQTVYNWARGKPRVLAVKGMHGVRSLVDSPSKVDVTRGGKKVGSLKLWPVGVDAAKSELYGFLGLDIGAGGLVPPGFCHFPEHDENFFKELTAEHLVTTLHRKTRRPKREWHVLPNRQNHQLDARVYARAAAQLLGIEHMLRRSKDAGAKKQAPAAANAEEGSARAEEAPQSAPGVTRKRSRRQDRGESLGSRWFGKHR